MEMQQLSLEIHQNAVDHGWWDRGGRSFPEIIALCHSELSEALEEYRKDMPALYFECSNEATSAPCRGDKCVHGVKVPENCQCRSGKPEGVAVELADCIIRILDYCGREGIDIDQIVRMKHEYNKTRPYRHGGKVC